MNEYNIKNKFGSKFTRNRTRQASAIPPIKVGRELRCEVAAERALWSSRTSYCIGQHSHIQAARAYFLSLILWSLFDWRSVIFFLSNGVRPLRKALVFFYLKSFGRYLFFLESVLADAILFSLKTVRTLAIDFLTWRILESFTCGCEDTLLTLSWASSF